MHATLSISGYVHRPAEYKQVVAALLGRVSGSVTALTTALRGAGGFGKTTLARAVCEDTEVRAAFPDGIFWVTLGEKVERDALAGRLNRLLVRMGETGADYLTAADASRALYERMQGRRILLVIDDVWNAAHLAPFLQGGPGCAHLVTTRNSDTLPPGTQKVLVDRVKPKEAADILSLGLGEISSDDRALLRALSDRLRRWPLLLSLANGVIARAVEDNGASLAAAVQYTRQLYDRHGLTAFDPDNALERNQAAAACLDASLSLLPADETAAFEELAVFSGDEDIPLAAVELLWNIPGRGLDEVEVRRRCLALAAHSLAADFNLPAGTLRLHDVVHAYLIKKLGAEIVRGLHGRLVDGYLRAANGKWWALPEDGYIHRRLVWHLAESSDLEEQVDFLFDYRWLKAALRAAGVQALAESYALAAGALVESPAASGARLLRDWVRLSGHILAEDLRQLPSQLLGRLLGIESENIQALLEGAKQERGYVWLQPVAPCMTPPGGAEIMTLVGHTGGINGVAITPDGQRAVSASDDLTLKIWDLIGGQEINTIVGHTDSINTLAITPDGQQAVSVDWATLRVWDLESGQELRTMRGHTEPVYALAITPDGNRVVSSSWNTIKVWDLNSGQELRSFDRRGKNRPSALAVTPDGQRAISATRDHMLKVWDLDSGSELLTLTGHKDVINAIIISPDGLLVSASMDHTLRVWDLETGKQLKTLEAEIGSVSPIAVTPDGSRAVSASYDNLTVWDLGSGQKLFTFQGHVDMIRGLAISPDGRRVISASTDHTLKVWDLESGQKTSTFPSHMDWITGLVVAPNGNRAVSISLDLIIVWNLDQKQDPLTISGYTFQDVLAVTPDGQQAIAVTDDNVLKVWDLNSGEKLLSLKGHKREVQSLAITPNGELAVSGSDDKTLKVWYLKSGKKLYNLLGHSDSITAVEITPDGQHAVSASDWTLIVWDIKSGQRVHNLEMPPELVDALALTPNGKYALAAYSNDRLVSWDLDSGQQQFMIDANAGSIHTLSITPQGKYVVAACSDGSVKAWNLNNGQLMRLFQGHKDAVKDLLILPGGRKVASVSDDNTLKVWDLETGSCLLTYHAGTVIQHVRYSERYHLIVAGDRLGRVHFLELVEPSQG